MTGQGVGADARASAVQRTVAAIEIPDVVTHGRGPGAAIARATNAFSISSRRSWMLRRP